MKGLMYFILAVCFVIGSVSAFWWLAKDVPLEEQIEYVKSKFSSSVEGSAVSNTTESATKLGRVLKNNFNEAQDVYENGAKYNN